MGILRICILSALFAAALAVTGCGSAEDPKPQEAKPAVIRTEASEPALPTETQLRADVRKYSGAFLSGDAASAWRMLSERCRDRQNRSEFNQLVSAGAAMYGDARITTLQVDTKHGSLARVSYDYDQPEINQDHEPWAVERGSWRNDDC